MGGYDLFHNLNFKVKMGEETICFCNKTVIKKHNNGEI